MSRMSREFGLVLLGSTMLTGAYAFSPSPEDEMEKKAEEQAARRTGNEHHYRSHGILIWYHSPMYSGSYAGRPAAYSPTARAGGFGSVGRTFGGGS